MYRLIKYMIPAVAAAALVRGAEQGREYSRASLLDRSPFAKPEKAGKTVSSGPLELRGFFGAGASLEVSLMRAGTAESVWVRVADKDAKWFVEAADPVAGTADVRYDGMVLRLKLALPESGDMTMKAPEAKEAAQDQRRPRRGGWADLSPASREILVKAMRDSMESLRKSNPEYFDGSALSDEQRKSFAAVREANFAKVREEVAKVAPNDLAKLDALHARMNERFNEPRAPRESAEPGSAPESGPSAEGAPKPPVAP